MSLQSDDSDAASDRLRLGAKIDREVEVAVGALGRVENSVS